MGGLRIVTPRIAYGDHLEPFIATFCEQHPQVVLDITINDAIVDIVAERYDLGIRLGEFLEEGVVAFPTGGPIRQLAAASPGYLARHGTPRHPKDLHQHRCINWRQPGSTTAYRWEFAKGKKQLAVAVNGPLILNDRAAAAAAAVQGIGIAFWAEHRLRTWFASGQLVPLLQDWSPSFPGFFGYYRKGRQPNPVLKAFVDSLKKKTATESDRSMKLLARKPVKRKSGEPQGIVKPQVRAEHLRRRRVAPWEASRTPFG